MEKFDLYEFELAKRLIYGIDETSEIEDLILFEDEVVRLFDYSKKTYKEITKQLYEYIDEYYEILKDLERESKTLDEINKCQKNISHLENKRKILKELYDEKEKEELIGIMIEKFKTTKVIFPVYNDSSLIERDLDDINDSQERTNFEIFFKLIYELVNNIHYNNEEKEKKLTNNKSLEDIWEKKDDQARLYFRYARGFIIVLGAATKKDDNSKQLLNRLTYRKSGTNKLSDKIKLNKLTKEEIENLIEESTKVYERLLSRRNLNELRKI